MVAPTEWAISPPPHSNSSMTQEELLQDKTVSVDKAMLAWLRILAYEEGVGNKADPIKATSASSLIGLIKALIKILGKIDLTGIQLTEETATHFCSSFNMTNLAHLKASVNDTLLLASLVNTPSTLSRLKELHLTCRNNPENRKELVSLLQNLLKHAKNLTTCSLKELSLTDDELAQVFSEVNLSSITTLDLSENQLTEKSLNHLSEQHPHFLQKVESLELSKNQIKSIPKIFVSHIAKPGLSLFLTHNLLSKESLDAFADLFSIRKIKMNMVIEILPQKETIQPADTSSIREKLHAREIALGKTHLDYSAHFSHHPPKPFDLYFRRAFNTTQNYCSFPEKGGYYLTSEMIRSLVTLHLARKTEDKDEITDTLKMIFTSVEQGVSLPSPYAPPPKHDSISSLISEETVTVQNASLRWWRLLRRKEVLDLSVASFTSVPAAVALFEILSYPDGPIKEVVLGNNMSDSCWEIFTACMDKIESLKALNYPDIPMQKMEDLKNKGQKLLPKLYGLDLSGPPQEEFLDTLLEIAKLTPFRYLDISGRKIGDNGIKAFLRIRQPEYLYLDDNKITDRGLEATCQVYQSGRLKELSLNTNPITSLSPLLTLSDLQPLTVTITDVAFPYQHTIDFYNKLLEIRNESYLYPVKHEFCYALYTTNQLATLVTQQGMLNIQGYHQNFFSYGFQLKYKLFYAPLPFNQPTVDQINNHSGRNFLVPRFLSKHFTIGPSSNNLLELLSKELELEKDKFGPDVTEKELLKPLQKILPFPIFIFHKDSLLEIRENRIYPKKEKLPGYFAIYLYRTEEGVYSLLSRR